MHPLSLHWSGWPSRGSTWEHWPSTLVTEVSCCSVSLISCWLFWESSDTACQSLFITFHNFHRHISTAAQEAINNARNGPPPGEEAPDPGIELENEIPNISALHREGTDLPTINTRRSAPQKLCMYSHYDNLALKQSFESQEEASAGDPTNPSVSTPLIVVHKPLCKPPTDRNLTTTRKPAEKHLITT